MSRFLRTAACIAVAAQFEAKMLTPVSAVCGCGDDTEAADKAETQTDGDGKLSQKAKEKAEQKKLKTQKRVKNVKKDKAAVDQKKKKADEDAAAKLKESEKAKLEAEKALKAKQEADEKLPEVAPEARPVKKGTITVKNAVGGGDKTYEIQADGTAKEGGLTHKDIWDRLHEHCPALHEMKAISKVGDPSSIGDDDTPWMSASDYPVMVVTVTCQKYPQAAPQPQKSFLASKKQKHDAPKKLKQKAEDDTKAAAEEQKMKKEEADKPLPQMMTPVAKPVKKGTIRVTNAPRDGDQKEYDIPGDGAEKGDGLTHKDIYVKLVEKESEICPDFYNIMAISKVGDEANLEYDDTPWMSTSDYPVMVVTVTCEKLPQAAPEPQKDFFRGPANNGRGVMDVDGEIA